jgi:LAGLIDADG-like domain
MSEIHSAFVDLADSIERSLASHENVKNIIDFVDTEIDKDLWGIDLNITQRVILKTYYQLELSPEELDRVLELKTQNKTTWERIASEPYQYLIIEAGRRASKCQTIDSLVLTKTGYKYLYEILSHSFSIPVLASNELANGGKLLNLLTVDRDLPIAEIVALDGKSKTAVADKFYIKGDSQTRKITTRYGYTIEGTPEHRIKILNKNGNIVWKHIADLEIGDYACVHRSTNLFPLDYLKPSLDDEALDYYLTKPKIYPLEVRESTGALLGLLTGAGTWENSSSLELNFETSDLNYYLEVLDRNGICFENIYRTCNADLSTKVSIHSSLLRHYYRDLGFLISDLSVSRKIPWTVRYSPKTVQASFLSHLFSVAANLDKHCRNINFTHSSKSILCEVQLLLLNFGIVSRISSEGTTLIVAGRENLAAYANEITFALNRKQQRLVRYLSKAKGSQTTVAIPYQHQWLERIRRLIPPHVTKQRNRVKQLDKFTPKLHTLKQQCQLVTGCRSRKNPNKLFTGQRLDRLLNFGNANLPDSDEVAHFQGLKDANYFYDPIVSIQPSQAFCVDLCVPNFERYVAQGFTNHNSSLCSVIVAYEFYRLWHIPNPQKHYGIGSNTPIVLLILATTADQAKSTIFAQICGLFPLIKCFKRSLSSGEIRVGVEEILCKSKLLSIKSGNSKSSSQVGHSIIVLVMDEIARIEGRDPETKELEALKLWDNLGASGLSFGKDAKRLALSSAWFLGDPIDELYEHAKLDPILLGFKLKTWDLNPKYHRHHPLIASAYKRNQRIASLDYEGVRRLVGEGYFDEAKINRCWRGDIAVQARPKNNNSWEVDLSLVLPTSELSCAYLDPAFIKDNYAVAIGRRVPNGAAPDLIVVDIILVWKPTPTQRVSLLDVGDLIIKIHQQRPIIALGSDYYNSVETTERLTIAGIPSTIHAATNKLQCIQYDTARQLMEQDRLVLPRASYWRDDLTDELIKVSQVDGVKMTHPIDGSKDIADAVAGLCWLLERTATKASKTEVVQTVPDRLKIVRSCSTQTTFKSGYKKFFNSNPFKN